MAKKKRGTATPSATILLNRKVRHDYFIEDTVEAGLALQGWEVKSLRDNRVQLRESYVVAKGRELFLVGAHVTPLPTASTHVTASPTRDRKLLLHRKEIDRLAGAVDRQGYTLVPVRLYWSRGKVKLEVGTARGKKQHDKRATERERDWKREQERTLKQG